MYHGDTNERQHLELHMVRKEGERENGSEPDQHLWSHFVDVCCTIVQFCTCFLLHCVLLYKKQMQVTKVCISQASHDVALPVHRWVTQRLTKFA